MQLNTVVIDDDPLSREIAGDFVSQTGFLSLAGSFTNPVEAANLLSRSKVQLLLLDIEMPQLTGMQFIQTLPADSERQIIITTSHPGYAVEAFDKQVSDYLVKPLSYDRFYQAALRVQQLASISDREQEESVFIKTVEGMVRIVLNEIDCIEADSNYMIVTCGSIQHQMYGTMKDMEERLKNFKNFVRVHRSYIVNTSKIGKIVKGMVLINNKSVPIGMHYEQNLMKNLKIL